MEGHSRYVAPAARFFADREPYHPAGGRLAHGALHAALYRDEHHLRASKVVMAAFVDDLLRP
jgi:hypothetical protein